MSQPPPAPTPALRASLAGASAVRFLCSGNVVRSAFAELYARHLGLRLPVDSAATRFDNPALFDETRAALLARGVARARLDAFRPRPLWRLDEPPDAGLLVLGMTVEHLRAWRALHPAHARVHRLLELEGREADLADPVLEGADFGRTFATLARCVERLAGLLGPG